MTDMLLTDNTGQQQIWCLGFWADL